MLVFIDDSGDPGFKLDKGSTRYFVIAMVIFDDDLEAEKVAIAIKQLRRDLGFSDDAEFRFFKTRHEVRLRFYQTIKDFNFRVRYLLVDKNNIYSTQLKEDKNSFYAFFIKTALKHSDGTIVNAKIKIDGGGDRAFRKNFLSYLRRELNSANRCVVKRCRLVDSRTSVLIQVADMIAGCINRAQQTDRKINEEYFQIIKKRIQDSWHFGK